MATHRKQPAPPVSSPRGVERNRPVADLSDLEAPTNAFPIGQGLRGRGGDKRRGPAIEWNDENLDADTKENPINNDIDDLLEDVPFEDPPREVTIPAWMLLVWFACATSLFGLAIVALVAALLFA